MDLFNVKREHSPRLQRWMNKHHVNTMRGKHGRWIAYKEETRHQAIDEDENQALEQLARMIRLPHWNDQL